MKKYLSIVLVLLYIFTYCISVSSESTVYTYQFEDITVLFEETTNYTEQQREKIAYELVYGNQGVSTCAAQCVLFGHDYSESECVTTITHRVYDTAPRCFKEVFLISKCSRCEHYNTERIDYGYIDCCPEE